MSSHLGISAINGAAGVRTIQQAPQAQPQVDESNQPEHVVLRLRRRGVTWAGSVVDNEGQGRKSSKKCCIYHKPREFGEWSDHEDSDCEGHDHGGCAHRHGGGDMETDPQGGGGGRRGGLRRPRQDDPSEGGGPTKAPRNDS